MLEPEFTDRLKSGAEVLVRTANACDEKCIAEQFAKLSDQSRYMRFFSSIRSLSDSQLKYLANVDNLNHVMITVSALPDDMHSGMGLGRYIRLQEHPHIAEFAITVVDKYQHQGVGSLLLQLLIEHARGNDIEILRGYVLASNAPMLRLFELYGFESTESEDGLLGYDLHLDR